MVQSDPTHSRHSGPDQVVVLLLPDLVDCTADCEGLHKTFDEAPGEKRLLVCIPSPNTPAGPLFSALASLNVEKQFLLGPDLEKPHGDEFVVRAPPDMPRDDVIEFALALSDVVLVSPGNENKQWAQHAGKKLGRTLVAVGSSVRRIAPETTVDVTKWIDPDSGAWLAWGRRWFGRPEQLILECLAVFGWGDGKKRRHRVWRCFRLSWRPRAYFAPSGWQDACPDKVDVDDSELSKCFEAMDRSALYGSHIHRDITWASHLAVAFAVFFAVAGYSYVGHHLVFAVLELVSLGIASLVVVIRLTRLQDRWTACRLGAEQLRIARMSLPLLVLPSALATADAQGAGDAEDPTDFELSALGQVKRAVRQQGLPRVDYGSLNAAEAARWLQMIVADQMHYHEHNHHTLERAEKSLNRISTIAFAISVLGVVLPLCVPSLHDLSMVLPWLAPAQHDPDPRFLIISAAGPALTAALHGAGTRLGFVHRAALSHDMNARLKQIFQALNELIRTAGLSKTAWNEVRALAYAAADAMGAENSSWHRLVRRYRDELP